MLELNVLTLIIAVTVIVSYMGSNNDELVRKNLLVPYLVHHEKQGYRLFSYMLFHKDTAHLIFNMFSLYFLGDFLLNVTGGRGMGVVYYDGFIQEYGSLKGQVMFLMLYVCGGLAATLIPMIRNKDNSYYSALGASGAVSAIVFAAIMWNPGMELGIIFLPGIRIPAYIFGPLYLLFEYIMDKRGTTNIGHDAHIGGAVFGILFAIFTKPDVINRFINEIF